MKRLLLIFVLLAVLAIPATSMAKTDVFVNFGLGVPGPVYVAPPVVVYPRPYIVHPAPVIISPYGHYIRYHKPYRHHHRYHKRYYKHHKYDDDDEWDD
jgi:hypothetical protein